MTTLFSHGLPSTTNHSPKADAADFEPDDEWKKQLKARIQLGLQSLIQDAKNNQLAELRKAVVTPEERNRLDIEYKAAMASIKQLANDQYQAELEKERNQRRWIAGEPMLPGWSTYLKAEQEHIMNTIKQGGDQLAPAASSEQPYSHSPSPQPTAPVTPATRTPEPRETSTPSSTLASPQRKVRRREAEPSTVAAPSHPDPDDLPPQEREKPRSRQQTERRTSIPSRDREEEPSPVGRRPNGSAHERPSNSWMSAEVVDEPEEMPNHAPSRTRYSSDKAPDRPWEGSLGRSSGGSVRSMTLSERGHTPRSPSNQPEGWKSSVNPSDELMASKPYANQVHRRGSTTSMRSNGSGASIRPMTETIPEREDGAEEGSRTRDWAHEPEKVRKTTDKGRLARRDSRSTPVDVTVPRHDEPLGSGGGMRSAGPSSATMQYATTSSSMKSLSNKSSFVSTEDRERYYQDRPPKPAPYLDARDPHYPSHREPRYPVQDRELPRPPPPRSPYGGDDREYAPPANMPPPRPPPPRSPYNGDDREYTPIRDLLASRPSSSRPYNGEERDYHTPPPAVRSPVPPRSPYDDNYNNAYAPPPARHVNGVKSPFVDREYGPPSAAHKGSFGYEDRRRESWERPEREPLWDDDRDHRDRDRESVYSRGERDRDREREQRLEWERERDRERDRDAYPDARGHPPSHYAYGPPQRSGSYPTPPSSANRHGSHDYLPMGDLYDGREPGPPSRGYGYRDHPPPPPPPPSVPPEEYDYEYQRQESARTTPPTRQGSYSRREPGDRRMDDIDPHARLVNAYGRGTRPPAEEVSEKPEPAWRGWGRSPQDMKPSASAYTRAPAGLHPRQRPRGQLKPKQRPYRGDPPSEFEDPHYRSPEAGQETESDSDEEDEEDYYGDMDIFAQPHEEADDSEGADDEHDNRRRQHEEPPTSDDEDVVRRKIAEVKLQHQANELKRLEQQERFLEEETRRKEEEVRAKEEELRKKEEEAAKKAAEVRLKEEEAQRKAEEARLKEEEALRKAEEARKMEEELRQKEEEAARKAEEARKIEEEAKQKAVEAKKKEDEAKKKEAEAKKKEREVNRRELEAKRKAADAKKLEEEAKRKEDELKKKEKATREKEEKLKQESEKTKMLQQEAQKIADEAMEKQEKLRQLEEDARRWEREIREREQALHVREEELKRREAEAKMKEEEAKRMEAEAQQKEAEMKRKEDLAQIQKEEAAKREQARVAEQARRTKEEAARREEAKATEHARLAKEEAVKREELRRAEQARAEEASLRRILEEETRRAQQDQRRKEAERMVAEQARRARDEAERPMFDIDSPFLAANDLTDDLFLDPKLVEEQAYIWQQVQYQQQADTIQRKRQEQRSRHDSLGTDTSSWPYPPGPPPPQPPPTSSSRPSPFPQSSPFSSAPPSERSSGTSSAWNGAGSAWSSSSKSNSSATSGTSATSSRTPNGTQAPKPAMNIPQGKPRNGSFSSGTPYPAGSSPHSTPGTEEWQRRQAEFTNAQQEKFRREQEKMEADMQMRSAGKPLSRDDMQRVFEKHERLWTQLPQKSDLTWNDFPWPMSKIPASPDDISSALVGAYMQSNCWPDKDKSKSTKDRIKEHIKRWHPDRFETKLLPKVVESEKDKVKQGAGNVARYLSDLLRKENDNSSSSNIFGGD